MRYTCPESGFRMPRKFRKFLPAGLLVLGAAVPVLLAVEATHQPACDRDCLLAVSSNYVDAILAHNPSALKVAPDLKSTENGKPVSLGEGLWKTAKAVPVRQSFADASTGQAGMFGVVTEQNGQRHSFALRLKIDHERIREVETVVTPVVVPTANQ
jgi:hypothetical protein